MQNDLSHTLPIRNVHGICVADEDIDLTSDNWFAYGLVFITLHKAVNCVSKYVRVLHEKTYIRMYITCPSTLLT